MSGAKKWKKPVLRIGVVVLFALVCFVGGMLAGGRESQPQVTTDLISQRLSEITELSVVDYHYTNMGKFEDRVDFYGWKVPLTMKRFIISYDGQVKAGVDLGKATVDVSGKKITVRLPKAEILSHEIDTDSIQVFDETRNIFNPIRITDYVDFSKDQKGKVEEQAVEKGLLTEAQSKAKQVIEQWLSEVMDGERDHEIVVTNLT